MADRSDFEKILNELGYKSYYGIVAQFQHNVFSTVYTFTRNKQDAEDLSQEIFLLIYQNLHTFRVDSKLSTWIYRVAINRCLEYTRKQSRRKNIAAFVPIDNETNADIPDKASVDAEIISSENKQMLYRALNSMNQKYTAVLTLKYMQNLTAKEIGEVLNLPPKTVETQLYRARAKLKSSLESLGYSSEENNNGL